MRIAADVEAAGFGEERTEDSARPSRLRRIALLVGLLSVVSVPWWGRWIASQLSFFQVRKVEIVGARFISPGEILDRLAVDTNASIWADPGALERRVARHPQVRDVSISRRLPGTLVVTVEENLPIALVPGPNGFRAYDASGRLLPLDPSRVPVDLPILSRSDTSLLRLLAEVRRDRPELFSRISEVRRVSRSELLVMLSTVPVRMMADVTVQRLDDIPLVEADLARRQLKVAELDLRYREQVIARLQ